MPNIGPLEIAIVLVIVLIIFGPRRLPELGRSMGRGIRDFRSAMGSHDEKSHDETKDDDDDSVTRKRAELDSTTASDTATGTATGSTEKPVEGEVITERKS